MRTTLFAALTSIAAIGCGTETEPPPTAPVDTADVETQSDQLYARCLSDRALAPEGAWFCDEHRVLECSSPNGTQIPRLHLVLPQCGQLRLDPSGPFALGDRAIQVLDRDGHGAAMCTTTLSVVDSTAPQIVDRQLDVDPDGAWAIIRPEDCAEIRDTCDPNVQLSFVYVESDEEAAGDVVGPACGQVQLRAERRERSDGRVYTLGLRAIDASGNTKHGTCTVTVGGRDGRSDARGRAVFRQYAPRC